MRGMRKNAKHALIFAAAILGGIAAGMRCDASEWVDNSSQTNPRGAAYTVKTYTEGSDPFDAMVLVCRLASSLRFERLGARIAWMNLFKDVGSGRGSSID